MPRSKRLHTDDPEWIRRKPAIEMMYVFDRLSQKKIRDKLEEDGFFVTKSELEAQLHFWNIRKNASADVWRYTDHRLLKREQQGKVSVVYYNRKQVSCNTLKKERSRYQPDALTKYTTAESPKTPEGMELCICTPPAAPTQSRWPQTLPWIRFQDSILLTILHLTNKSIYFDPQQPVNQKILDFSSLHRPLNTVPSRTASDFAVNIASMMPENAENEIANRAQLIVQGTAEQAINEHIKLILYCLSNNMYEINYGDDSSWLTVVNLINRSGLTNWPLDLAQQKDLTIASIAEKLFMLCIEFILAHSSRSWTLADNSNIISWLLKSGQNPDVKVKRGAWGVTPLHVATQAHDYELALELLDAGADPNLCQGLDNSPLIELLRDEKGMYWERTPEQRKIFKNLVLRLLESGASLDEHPFLGGPSALMWAVRLDLEIADILIQYGAKVEFTHNDVYLENIGCEFVTAQGVIGFAMLDSDEDQAMRKIQHLISHVQRSDSSISVADLLIADEVCLAAYLGFKEVIRYCYGSQNYVSTGQHVLFSALCAASYGGNLETCELLLRYGAPTKDPERLKASISPLHFAALKDHSTIIKLLCQHGADVNAEFETGRNFAHPTNCMWNRVIKSLRSSLRNMLDSHPLRIDSHSLRINPLGAAILGADERIPQSFETFIQYGAKMPIWAVYYGASVPQHFGIAFSAVAQGGNMNWRGPDGRTPLQKALQPFTMTTRTRDIVMKIKQDENDSLALISAMVAAGAETAGSEAELIVLLDHWSHPDEVSTRSSPHHVTQLKACSLSILAAIFLTRSTPRIERALAKCPGAYDPSALCAGVMLAISSGSTGPLQQLIINRPEDLIGTEPEGIALGLAAWHSRADILDMLISKIQSSTQAFVPVYTHCLWRSEDIPTKASLQANITELFEEKIPFWHREQPLYTQELLRGSPLAFSIWSHECLDKLLESNFRPDALTLSVAMCNGEVEILEKLLRKKWEDGNDADPPRLLSLSVKRKMSEMTKILLKAGCSPNEPHELVSEARSPLQQAVEDGNLEMIDLLLESHADFDAPAAKCGGATALQLAAIKGRLGIARRLIDLGANINASGAEIRGRTALEGAAEHGRLDMVQLLLDGGANVVGDGCLQYFKAIRFAETEAHVTVARFLKNYREWANSDSEMWELFMAIRDCYWQELKELDRSSVDKLIASYAKAHSPDGTMRLDMHSDDASNDSHEESLGDGRISPKEAACVASGQQ